MRSRPSSVAQLKKSFSSETIEAPTLRDNTEVDTAERERIAQAEDVIKVETELAHYFGSPREELDTLNLLRYWAVSSHSDIHYGTSY